jgi:glycosyltransferase involved in cell wall biosynthesis
VRDSWLSFGFVSLKRFLRPVAVKVVTITTDEAFFNGSKIYHQALTARLGYSLEVYVIRNADIVFTVPGSFSERLARIRGRSKGIVELPQPVPIELFKESQPMLDSKDEYLVGYVGGLAPIHSVDVIVKAMHLIQREMPNTRLLITGDGDPRYVSYITELMAKLKVKGSLMLRIPESELCRIYKSLHLLVIPRSQLLNNVLPMKFIEATVANVPVVATKTKALYQLLTGSGVEDKMLVSSNDPHSWASRIKELLINDDLRLSISEVMSKYLKPYVELHRPEAIAEKFLNSIKQYDD